MGLKFGSICFSLVSSTHKGSTEELRRRGGNDRLFKWEVKDTTNVSEVGHCLILTARLRETQAKEVMSGQRNILQKFSSQESQEKEKVDRLYWVAWQSWWWCNKNNLLSLFFLLLSLTSMAPDSNLKFRFLLYFYVCGFNISFLGKMKDFWLVILIP